MSARKSSHRTIFLIVSNGSPLALIASSLRSTSKKPVCPMTRSLDPPMAHCGQRVRFVATWREEFFEVPAILRPGRSEEESGPHEQEDQSYVADEVLVERPGGGDAGHPEVPVFGDTSMKRPFATAATPITTATPRQSILSISCSLLLVQAQERKRSEAIISSAAGRG